MTRFAYVLARIGVLLLTPLAVFAYLLGATSLVDFGVVAILVVAALIMPTLEEAML